MGIGIPISQTTTLLSSVVACAQNQYIVGCEEIAKTRIDAKYCAIEGDSLERKPCFQDLEDPWQNLCLWRLLRADLSTPRMV